MDSDICWYGSNFTCNIKQFTLIENQRIGSKMGVNNRMRSLKTMLCFKRDINRKYTTKGRFNWATEKAKFLNWCWEIWRMFIRLVKLAKIIKLLISWSIWTCKKIFMSHCTDPKKLDKKYYWKDLILYWTGLSPFSFSLMHLLL